MTGRPQGPKVDFSYKDSDTGHYFVYTDDGWTEATEEEAAAAQQRYLARDSGRRLVDSIHAYERDPATEEWGKALIGRVVGTNQLRETQAALAASQADLTAMQTDRDALAVLNAELKDEAAEMRRQAQNWLAKLEETARALATANHRNRILAAENEAALRQLNELREVL